MGTCWSDNKHVTSHPENVRVSKNQSNFKLTIFNNTPCRLKGHVSTINSSILRSEPIWISDRVSHESKRVVFWLFDYCYSEMSLFIFADMRKIRPRFELFEIASMRKCLFVESSVWRRAILMFFSRIENVIGKSYVIEFHTWPLVDVS